jgi:hypothetical protein
MGAFGFVRSPQSEAGEPIARKIRSFANLPEGWHYGEGGPLSKSTIDAALDLASFLVPSVTNRIDAVPSQNLNVVILAQIGNEYMEVVIHPDQTCVVIRDGDEEDRTDHAALSLAQVKRMIQKMLGEACITQDGFIKKPSHTNLAGSPVQSFIPREEAFHWWTAPASTPAEFLYVTMHGSTTVARTPLENRRYTGGSTQTYYQPPTDRNTKRAHRAINAT